MSENKKRVLVVEDDEHISKVYQIKLAKEGLESSLAVDGDEAVEKIISEKPDLVILDLMLPKKDGFGVLEELKKIPDHRNPVIIVLSNLGQKSDQDRAIALGAREYLVKVDNPIQDIINKVKGYLSS